MGVLAEFTAEATQTMQRNVCLIANTSSLPGSRPITCCVLGEEESDEFAGKAMGEKKPQTLWEENYVHSFKDQDYIGLCYFPLPGTDSSICGHFLMPSSSLA